MRTGQLCGRFAHNAKCQRQRSPSRATRRSSRELAAAADGALAVLHPNPRVGEDVGRVGEQRLARALRRALVEDCPAVSRRVVVDDDVTREIREVWEKGEHDLVVMGPGVALFVALLVDVSTLGLVETTREMLARGCWTSLWPSQPAWLVGIRNSEEPSAWVRLSGNAVITAALTPGTFLSLRPREHKLARELPTGLVAPMRGGVGAADDRRWRHRTTRPARITGLPRRGFQNAP